MSMIQSVYFCPSHPVPHTPPRSPLPPFSAIFLIASIKNVTKKMRNYIMPIGFQFESKRRTNSVKQTRNRWEKKNKIPFLFKPHIEYIQQNDLEGSKPCLINDPGNFKLHINLL